MELAIIKTVVDEIDDLYSVPDVVGCECDISTEVCAFHQRMLRISHLQDSELTLLTQGLDHIDAVLSETKSVLESMDAEFISFAI